MNLRFLLGRYKYNSDASGIPPTPRDAGILPSRAPLPDRLQMLKGCWDSWLARRGRGAAGEPPPPQTRNRRVRSPSALNPPAAVRGWNRLPLLLSKSDAARESIRNVRLSLKASPLLNTGTRLFTGQLKQAVLRRLLMEELTEPLRWIVSSAALAHQRIYPLQQYFLDGLSACPVRPIPFFLSLKGKGSNYRYS